MSVGRGPKAFKVASQRGNADPCTHNRLRALHCGKKVCVSTTTVGRAASRGWGQSEGSRGSWGVDAVSSHGLGQDSALDVGEDVSGRNGTDRFVQR